MTIPLVDDDSKNSINTSVIAIKKEIEQINSLLQNLNNKLKSLSDNDFLYRSDLTDTVTVGDNQPVTSNGVAQAISSEASARDSAIESANYLMSIGNNNSPNDFPSDAMRIYRVRNYNIGWVGNDGLIINIPWSNDFCFQIALDDQSNWLAVRSKANNVWNDWTAIFSGTKLNPLTFTYTMKSGYSCVSFVIDSNSHFTRSGVSEFQLSIGHIAGGTIGSTSTNIIANCNLRPLTPIVAIGIDYISGRPIRMQIASNGDISIMESIGVTSGNNQLRTVFVGIF